MDKEWKNKKWCKGSELDFLLRWGNKKRLRCVKVKDGRNVADKSDCLGSKKITSHVDHCVVTAEKEIIWAVTSGCQWWTMRMVVEGVAVVGS